MVGQCSIRLDLSSFCCCAGPPEDEWTNMVHLIAAAASESITSLICFLNGTAAQAKLAKPQPSGMQLLAAFSNAQQYTSVTALPGCNAPGQRFLHCFTAFCKASGAHCLLTQQGHMNACLRSFKQSKSGKTMCSAAVMVAAVFWAVLGCLLSNKACP